MPGRCYTFVSVELDNSIEFSKQSLKKKERVAEAIESLLTSDARLLSVQRDSSWRAILQFASTETAIRSAGSFARQYIAAKKGKLPIRIGISTGEVTSEFPTVDEATVQRAIWLSGVAPTSGILLCRATAAIAEDLELFPYWVAEHGELFNFDQVRLLSLWVLRHNELPEPLPVVDAEIGRDNIPAIEEFFIGREAEVGEIIAGLMNNHWVTLVGPSGIGKSMLARRVALEQQSEFRDGVRYVNLSGVATYEDVVSQLFQSIGLNIDHLGQISLATIRSYFGSRNHLILLDGCERCIEVIRPIVKSLLETRGVQILATSTIGIGLPHEEISEIPAFGVPPADRQYTFEQLESYDATALLLDRYRLTRPLFEPSGEEARQIVEICRLLGGHPLGIALAARNLRTQSFTEVLESVKAGVMGTGRSKNDRHKTLDDAVRWTVRALDKPTCRILETASVFEDRFSRDDLAEMTDFGIPVVTEALETLIRVGLVIDDNSVDSPERYGLLPYVRHAMRGSMESHKEWPQIREQHFLRLYHKFVELLPGINGPDQAIHLDRLDAMRRDFESALRYLVETQSSQASFLEAMGHCWSYWYRRNRLTPIIGLAESARLRCIPEEVEFRARLDLLAAIFETKAGQSDSAQMRLRRALKAIDGHDFPKTRSQILNSLGGSLWASGLYAKASKALDEAIQYGRMVHEIDVLSPALSTSVAPLLDEKRYKLAWERLEELAKITESRKDPMLHWGVQLGRGEYYCETGDYTEALRQIDLAIKSARKIGDPSILGRCYLWRAQTLLWTMRYEESAESLGHCLYLLGNGEQALYATNLQRIVNIEGRIQNVINEAQLNIHKMYGSMQGQLDTGIM